MKKLLVIAIALASTNAFASRARMISLGNSAHVTDTQAIYTNPAKMFLFGNLVSLESGQTATNTVSSTVNTNNNAEGLLLHSVGDAKIGLGLGHKSENASAFGLRALLGALPGTQVTEQQNPVELMYGIKAGDVSYAANLIFSNYNDKKQDIKENSSGVRLGMLMGDLDAALSIGLSNVVKDKTALGGQGANLKGTIGLQLNVGYKFDNLYTYGEVVVAGAKVENQTSGAELAKIDQTKTTLGVISSHKKDNNELFYGVKLVNIDRKNKVSDSKAKSLSLPVIVGFEADANSWLVLRGSLTQTVLVANSKVETGATTNTEFAPGANNTVAAIGAGLKFNNISIDGSLEGLTGGAAGQNLNGNTLLSTVGLTYVF